MLSSLVYYDEDTTWLELLRGAKDKHCYNPLDWRWLPTINNCLSQIYGAPIRQVTFLQGRTWRVYPTTTVPIRPRSLVECYPIHQTTVRFTSILIQQRQYKLVRLSLGSFGWIQTLS